MRYSGNGQLIFKAETIPVKYEVREIVTGGLRDHRGYVEGDPSAFVRLAWGEPSAKLEFEDGRILNVMFPRLTMGDSRIQIVGSGAIQSP
ncbi:hypothetical protein RIdsm_04742 [Roseovarius indicus]|uniref:Uncharacterized protein n=2 Tax=Roseovarius indicus TaxID=540747 RepID=A0A0T5PEX3_9RHOB|nr:hypothetical protein [Roseovarius indicus]KRS19744.1 hypothetical protein XM52_02630 [Roseovarius indicus]QEW28901.1 hypothetical protein RIdsm_04742 [Roseovarius indicus]SFD82859.1 hypothetical protein SAMN04488031_102760 [Roseovarius indicus]